MRLFKPKKISPPHTGMGSGIFKAKRLTHLILAGKKAGIYNPILIFFFNVTLRLGSLKENRLWRFSNLP